MSHDINTRFYVAKVERGVAPQKLSRVLYTHRAMDASAVNRRPNTLFRHWYLVL
jgi:hypothetical protein